MAGKPADCNSAANTILSSAGFSFSISKDVLIQPNGQADPQVQ